MKYKLILTSYDEEFGITTLLEDPETGNYVEETWIKEGDEWIAENEWGERGRMLPSLYNILGRDEEFCDAILNKLVASPVNEITFNA